MWCTNCENAINDMAEEDPFALQTWFDLQVQQIDELVLLVRGNLTDLQRAVIVALITTDVHARDLTEELKVDQVSSLFDFTWQKLLRYYWNDET